MPKTVPCQDVPPGADKSLARPGMKQAREHVRDAHDFNNIETRAVIKSPPPLPARHGSEENSRHRDRNISLFRSWSELRTYQHTCNVDNGMYSLHSSSTRSLSGLLIGWFSVIVLHAEDCSLPRCVSCFLRRTGCVVGNHFRLFSFCWSNNFLLFMLSGKALTGMSLRITIHAFIIALQMAECRFVAQDFLPVLG